MTVINRWNSKLPQQKSESKLLVPELPYILYIVHQNTGKKKLGIFFRYILKIGIGF